MSYPYAKKYTPAKAGEHFIGFYHKESLFDGLMMTMPEYVNEDDVDYRTWLRITAATMAYFETRYLNFKVEEFFNHIAKRNSAQ